MSAELTTKERIVREALKLFSIKGFKGTSVKNIADAVGIKDSSLYKHFSSKREIFDTIVEEMKRRMENLSVYIGIPANSSTQAQAEAYGELSIDDLQEMSKKIFLFYLKDEFASSFWRMANMEQYQNEEIYEIFRSIFMEDSIQYLTDLFAEMVRKKIFIDVNPGIIAMNFYAPIFFLLSKYNGRGNEEEALAALSGQVAEFARVYKA